MTQTRLHADNAGNGNLPFACERELRAIAKALENAHLLVGIAGLILGASAGCLLLATGVGLFTANPALFVVLTGFLGAALGLWLGARGPAHVAAARNESVSRGTYHQYR